jgi:DNA polymerase elongation subunit (family B)
LSFRNVHYDHRTSTIHLWHTVKGERVYDRVEFVPYVFVPVAESGVRSLEGSPVAKKTFRNYFEYQKFQKENFRIYENKVKPEYQFLAERYFRVPDDELETPRLRTFTIDIEVHSEKGFPKPEKAVWPVTLITIWDGLEEKMHTWGLKPYAGDNDRVSYRHFTTEEDLLKDFFLFFHRAAPDVLTGWSINGFDVPYLINRCRLLFGEDEQVSSLLSPINVVRTWDAREDSRIKMNVDIAGVSILDYLDVYKKFTPHNHERHSLDFIARFELEKGKLDYSEYEDIRELYHRDWDKYVDYNIVDVWRVKQLEDKLGYIRLIQSLSLLTKCPMKFYDKVTSLIECLFLVYYRRNRLCAPYHRGGAKESYTAAYVKEPQAGRHRWVVDIDITSSYPTAMITLNMGNETYYGCVQNLNEQEVVSCVRNREFPEFVLEKPNLEDKRFEGKLLESFNQALRKGYFSIAPNGAVFKNDRKGAIAAVEEYVFSKRKEANKKKLEASRELERLRSSGASEEEVAPQKELKDRLHLMQLSLKLIINSIYGALAVPYYRGYNINIATAITSVGRHTVIEGERYCNEIMNDPSVSPALVEYLRSVVEEPDLRRTDHDYVSYGDTDSLFIKVGDFLNDRIGDWWEGKWDRKEKVENVIRVAKLIEAHVNRSAYEKIQLRDYASQVHHFRTGFKQEIVAQSILHVAKKKYGYWMVNKEGVDTDRLQVTGLEIIRSDTPELVRGMLKEIMGMILKDEELDDVKRRIDECKARIRDAHPEEIAANIGCNNLRKYIKPDLSTAKGADWHIKGVASYRIMLRDLGLADKYEDIEEGSKAKVVYLRPNKYHVQSLAFTRWPREFTEAGISVDIDKMIDKFFVKKLEMLLEPMDMLSVLNDNEEVLNCFF